MNIDFYDLDFYQLLLISAFVLFFLIQMGYYLGLFSHVAFYKRRIQLTDAPHEGISVIICARNERDNLERLLPKILEQNYSKFEVIVVNDCSTDDSEDVLNLLKTKYDNLDTRKITLTDGISRNNSIMWGVGIKAAKYEWIVLTDANCYPDNDNWLTTLQKNFNTKTDLVISYTSRRGNKLVRAGNFADALYYLSKACVHKTYTASGNNMAFRKSVFYDNKGFHPLLKVYDKADAVFVNTITKKDNTVVDLSAEAINNSALKLSFEKWKIKRRDELRSQRLFRRGTKNANCFEMITRGLFYALFAVTLYFTLNVQWAWITVAALFIVRLAIQMLIFSKAQKKLHEKGLLFTSLIWDLLSLFVYLPIVLQSKFDRR